MNLIDTTCHRCGQPMRLEVTPGCPDEFVQRMARWITCERCRAERRRKFASSWADKSVPPEKEPDVTPYMDMGCTSPQSESETKT